MGGEDDKRLQLEALLADYKEELFLTKIDLEKCRTENIALKVFIQNLYESCEGVEDRELSLIDVVNNLKQNIQVFAKAHQIRL